MFASSGDQILDNNDQSGIFGDVILVNGRPWPVMQVERRKYRFRILNASVSRSYSLSLSTAQAFTVIATDGGLMPTSQQAASIRIGMAERYEVVIDFAKYSKGARVILRNTSPKNNINYATTGQVMAFDVVSDATTLTNNRVPSVLNPNKATMGLTVADAKATRTFDFVRANSHWTINGKTWADVVASNYTAVIASPRLGDVELWELRNPSKGWFHPAHIHLVDFKVVDRNGKAPFAFEKGPKDVVYLGEGESVRLLIRFGPQVGRYMMHCHNLVHEDHDMMQQFQVLAADGTNGDDPIKASPGRYQPEVAP